MEKKSTNNAMGVRRRNLRKRKTACHTQHCNPIVVDIADDSNDKIPDSKNTLPSTSGYGSLNLDQGNYVPTSAESYQNLYSFDLLNQLAKNPTVNNLQVNEIGLHYEDVIGVNPSGYHNLESASMQAAAEDFANGMFFQNTASEDGNNMTSFVPETVDDMPIDYSRNAPLQNLQVEPVDLSHTSPVTLNSSGYGYNEPNSYISYPNMADIRRIKSYMSNANLDTSLQNNGESFQNGNPKVLQTNALIYPFNTLGNECPVTLNNLVKALNQFQFPCEINPSLLILQAHESNPNSLENSNQFLSCMPPENVLPYMYPQSNETFPSVPVQSVAQPQQSNVPRSRKRPRNSIRKCCTKSTDPPQMHSNAASTIEEICIPGQNPEVHINGQKECCHGYREVENLQSVSDSLSSISYLNAALPNQHAFANIDYSQNSCQMCTQGTFNVSGVPPNNINQPSFGVEMYRDSEFVERVTNPLLSTSQIGSIGQNREILRDKSAQSVLNSCETTPAKSIEIGNSRKVAYTHSTSESLEKSFANCTDIPAKSFTNCTDIPAKSYTNCTDIPDVKKMKIEKQAISNTSLQTLPDLYVTSIWNSLPSSNAESCPSHTNKVAEHKFPYESVVYCTGIADCTSSLKTSQDNGNESHPEIQNTTFDFVSENASSCDADAQDIYDILELPMDLAVSEVNEGNPTCEVADNSEVDAKEEKFSSPSPKNSSYMAEDWRDSRSPIDFAFGAFNKRKIPEFFELIKNNLFPTEHHEKLRDLWEKALIINYHQTTGLPCSGRQISLISKANPPPASIAKIFNFEVITIE